MPKFSLSLFALLLLLMGNAQPGQWNYIGPNRFYFGPDEIGDITFVDSLNGYVADMVNPKILQTSNGGLSWNEKPVIPYGNNYFTKMQFISPSKGWLCGGFALISTSDGGNSWLSLIDTNAIGHPNGYIEDFQFLDSLNGFVAGYYGAFKTTDGGGTWISIMPWNIDSVWGKVFFLNTDTGWLFSQDSMIAETSDGGTTWTAQKVSFSGGVYPADFITGAYFYNAQTGVAFSEGGNVFKTYNGGNNWIYAQTMPVTSAFLYKFNQSGFVYGPTANNMNIFSTDSGNTWSSEPVPDLGDDAIFAFSPQKWYGGMSQIYETVNGGVTFITDSQQYAYQYAIINYDYTGANSVLSVSVQYDAVFTPPFDYSDNLSTDGGLSWVIDSATDLYGYPITNIQGVSPTTWFAETENGVYRYQNGIITDSLSWPWQLVYAAGTDSFIVSQIIFDTIGGQLYQTDSFIVKKTTDGGNTWSTVYFTVLPSYTNTGEWNDFSMVRFMNWDTGIVAVLQYADFDVGDSLWSKESITFDGGSTWTSYPLNTSSGMIISTKLSPSGQLYCMRASNLYSGSYTMWRLNGAMQWDFVNYVNPQGSGDNLGANPYFQDFGWSADSILWVCNMNSNPLGQNVLPSLAYSLDSGATWNSYTMVTDPVTMFKQLRNGNFIAGTSTGDLLQYDGTIANGRIKGNVYYDFNANGVFDGNDIWANAYPVSTNPGGLVTYTSPGGSFTIPVDSGTYTVSPDSNHYFHSFPPSQQVLLNSQTAISTGNLFALQPFDTSLRDLVLYTCELWDNYPGATHYTALMYCNIGAEPITPTLMLVLDTALTFSNASLTPTSQSGDTIIWNLPMIYPGQNNYISVFSQISLGAQIGDSVVNYSTLFPLTGDQTPWNNSDTSSFIVGSSHDPNSKQVSPPTIAANQTSSQNMLTYTIFFQNTGTDSTHFIVVKDQLNPSLAPATFHLLGASAPCDYHFEEGNVLVFRFNNYQLPDSSLNPTGSRGFVSFMISPKPGFLTSDTIPNTASVYFDYNPVVNTNNAKIAVSGVYTSIRPVYGNLNIKIFPNPASSIVHLISDNDFDYKLFDLCGRPIQGNHVAGGRTNINVSNLASGVYYLQINQNGQTEGYSVCIVTH